MSWIINKNLTSDIKHEEFYSSLDSLINFKSKEYMCYNKKEDSVYSVDQDMSLI